MAYILDTNIITAILKENEKAKLNAQQIILKGEEVLINGISYYEIKRGLLASNATSQLSKFEQLCKNFELVLLDTSDIFDKAAQIYAALKQKGELVQDADILIASIVSSKNFILVTNDSDFKRIPEIKIENWLTDNI